MDDTRNRVLRALLGYAEDAQFLKEKFAENKDAFPALKIERLMTSVENQKNYIEKSERTSSSALSGLAQIQIDEQKAQIAFVEDMIQKMERGTLDFPEQIITELDKYVVVHSTDFYPVFDEKTKEWFIPTHTAATGNKVGRMSIHFAIDGLATATAMPEENKDTWSGKPFVIVAPLGQMIKENGLMDNCMPADTWWVIDSNEKGLRLPAAATIVARMKQGTGDIQESLAHRGGQGINKVTLDGSGESFGNFVKEKYNVEVDGLDNDTWATKSKRDSVKNLNSAVEKLNPFMSHARHTGQPEEMLERRLVSFLNAGLVADNEGASADISLENRRKEIIEQINKTRTSDGKIRIPREFARHMVKTGIL